MSAGVFIVVSIIFVLADLYAAVDTLRRKTPIGQYLGLACIGAAVVLLCYLVGGLAADKTLAQVMSGICFICTDWTLLGLLFFTAGFTRHKEKEADRLVSWGLGTWAAVESVIFTADIFTDIAVRCVPTGERFPAYGYDKLPLYNAHLAYVLVLVVLILALLLYKVCTVPGEYRVPFVLTGIAVAVVVIFSGLSLLLAGTGVLEFIIFAYSACALLMYWGQYHIVAHVLKNRLKANILENIDQGIVLFNFEDVLMLHNKKAAEMLSNVTFSDDLTLADFFRQGELAENEGFSEDRFSVQCYTDGDDMLVPLRCDFRALHNKKGRRVGKLFVFSDAAGETDLLTGFHNWDSFQRLVEKNEDDFAENAVAVCDLNGLTLLNQVYGRSAGDRRICALARRLRACFPPSAFFVRGNEAYMIVLCFHTDVNEMRGYMEAVKHSFQGSIQYAVHETIPGQRNVLETIREAENGMRAKKLMDHDSTHSEVLTSLVRTLQESDIDTEAHVRRTQAMSADLGARLGLSDVQQSDLSLLCILHDIGKVGIPLEILNKPGHLTDDERKVLQSHTEKGYQIVKSSQDLSRVADYIRYHHERWDGKGYPAGLSRETIPMLSRIIAVLDAYDAMINDRPYRPALPPQQAAEELKKCVGSQFDPYVVSVFLQLFDEGGVPQSTTAQAHDAAASTAAVSAADDQMQRGLGQRVHSIRYTRYVLNEQLKILSTDEHFKRLTGYGAEDVAKGMLQTDLIPPEDRVEYLCNINEQLAKTQMAYCEHRLRRKDGDCLYVFCCGRTYFDASVKENRSEIVVTDASSTYSVQMLVKGEQSKADARLKQWEHMYRRDPLTGLLSHEAFQNDVQFRLLRGDMKTVLLMIDVDLFKQYNDTKGHHAGDEFLIEISHLLVSALRKDDLACRMGGDEFAAALAFHPDVGETVIAERVQQVFDHINLTLLSAYGGRSISLGGAIADGDVQSFTQLYELADKELYHAKALGRGRLSLRGIKRP